MKRLLLVLLTTAAVPSAAFAQNGNSGTVPGLYSSKAEAEKAAPNFNCSGAHRMGDQWMPCAAHPKPGDKSTFPPLYSSKTEAEKAAPEFNCTGAHQMGDQWMPCATHPNQDTHNH